MRSIPRREARRSAPGSPIRSSPWYEWDVREAGACGERHDAGGVECNEVRRTMDGLPPLVLPEGSQPNAAGLFWRWRPGAARIGMPPSGCWNNRSRPQAETPADHPHVSRSLGYLGIFRRADGRLEEGHGLLPPRVADRRTDPGPRAHGSVVGTTHVDGVPVRGGKAPGWQPTELPDSNTGYALVYPRLLNAGAQ